MARRTQAEVVAILQTIPLFSNLTKKQLTALARETGSMHAAAGDVVMREQEWGQHLVAITAGEAKVLRNNRSVATVGAGGVIGEMSLLDGEPRSATVVAKTDLDGVVLHGTAFRALLEQHPSMVLKLLLAQTARLRELDKKVALYG